MKIERYMDSMDNLINRLTLAFVLFATAAISAGASEISQDISATMPVRGVVRSAAEAAISTDLTTIITKVSFREGEEFQKGDVLINLDCRRLNAELASAKARYRETKVALEAIAFLNKKNAGSRQDLETSRARNDQASAEADVIRAQIDRCNIIAPYDGRIVDLDINEHEMSVAGKPLLSIVSLRQPRLELIVPSTWLVWLQRGTRFQFRIDETDTSHMAMVSLLASSVDTVSQTIKVYAIFTGPTPGILPGMSGSAEFNNTLLGGLRE